MKRSKKILILISLMTIILGIISSIYFAVHANAIDDIEYVYQLAAKNYDTVIKYNMNDVDNIKEYDEEGNWNGKYRNLVCLHTSATGNDGKLSIAAIIDIDGDKATIQYKKLNSSNNKLSSKIVDDISFYDQKNKAMAALAYYADTKYKKPSESNYLETYIPFLHLWEDCGYRELIGKETGFNWPEIDEGKSNMNGLEDTDIWQFAKKYSGLNNTKITDNHNYKARIFLYVSDGGQERAVLFGKQEEAESVTINKYITKVEYLGSFSGKTESYSRESMPEVNVDKEDGTIVKGKKNNPVVVTNGDVIVHYTITVTNKSSARVTGTLTDIFGEFFSDLKSDGDNSFEIDSNGKIKVSGKEDITIDGNKSKTFKITLKGSPRYSGGPFKNTAKFVTKNGTTCESSDYVKVEHYVDFKIDKFITKVEDLGSNEESADIDLGDERAGWKDDDKEQDPVETAHGNVKVHYKIKVTNNSSIGIFGTIEDTFDGNFFHDLSGLPGETDIIWLDPGETKEFDDVTLLGNSEITDSNGVSYKNTVTFHSSNSSVSSSDYISVVPKGQVIHKTITEINSEINGEINRKTFSRERMTENDKVKYIVDAGTNDEEKTIVYKIEIYNKNKEKITGKFYDEADKGIIIDKMVDEKGNKIGNGDTLSIKGSTTITVMVTATVKVKTLPGIYRNTSRFIVDKTRRVIESSDYFELKSPIDKQPTGTIKKYITNIESANERENSTSDVFENVYKKDNRYEKDYNWKYEHPIEVEQGDIVTYRVDLTFKIDDPNLSAYDDEGNLCPDHYNKRIITSLSCEDVNYSGLVFQSISGENVSYKDNNGSFVIEWKDIKVNDISKEQTVSAELRFKVTALELFYANVENKVQNINYEYTKYTCVVIHGNWLGENTASDGAIKWCDHKSCHFTHKEEIVSGQIEGSDSDFVRILDPEIGGKVFLDQNGNNFYDGEDEQIKNMPKDQYKKISVELWRTGVRDGKSIDERVAVKPVDPITGEYSFGRVKRSPNIIITENISKNYDYDIGEGNYFYYKKDNFDNFYDYFLNYDYYHYYIIFNYDGERYEAVMDRNAMDLGHDTLSLSNLFVVNSNCSEEGREEFNNSLTTISYNRAFPNIDGSGDGKDLKYTTYDEDGNPTSNLQVSTALWDGDVDSSINMKARTSFPTLSSIYEETEYLKYMNLGLRERKYGDLSLTKDVVSAEVTVNGFKTTYEYGKLGTDEEFKPANNNTISKPYTLRIYREDYEYRTANQEEEIQEILNENNPYIEYGRTNDLEIILTYKITVTNKSDDAIGVVREIIDYSSKELELLKDTVTMNTPSASGIPLDVEVNSGNESKYKNKIYEGNSYSFNQNFFTGDIGFVRLAPGQELEVYSKYKVARDSNGYINIDNATVTRDSDGKIILEEVLGETKFNVAEIGAYSFVDKYDNPLGFVDKNSNPGNVEITDEGEFNTDHFEDDTFETGIGVILRDDTGSGGPPGDGNPPSGENPPEGNPPKIEKNAYRNISGIVFEEINKQATDNSDKQLVGDGMMKTKEDEPAENVIVKLFEVVQKKTTTGEVEKEYLVDTGLWYRTGKDGRYYFGDKVDGSLDEEKESIDDRYRLHAGTYVVRFVYGDEEDKLKTDDYGNTIRYSGQDYQSTKYQVVGEGEEDEIVEATVFAGLSRNGTEFDSDGEPTKGSDIYSVAKDNEVRRLEVNQYSTTTTYPMDTILKANNTEEKKLLSEHTAMFADTKMFNMQVEYYDNYTNKETKEIDGTLSVENYYYSVRDVNFGLIERPKTKLQLMNDISEIRAITSDGNTLIDLFFDVIYQQDGNGGIKHTSIPNMEKSTGYDQVQILNRNGSNQGFRYANIDNDILQGMVITIKFKIAIANNSEVDHISEWLEEKIEEDTVVELDQNVIESTETRVDKANEADGVLIDYLAGTSRKYDYTNSYLYKLLYNGATEIGQDGSGRTDPLRSSNTAGIYGYKATSGEENKVGSDNIKSAYTYTNIKKVQPDYKLGYYLGNIYYYNTLYDHSIESAEVRTRVDQFVDYVDNDLVFKPEENVNSEEQIKYVTYSLPEIGSQGILKDIYSNTENLTDGEKDYISNYISKTAKNTNNNLAFNVEDKEVNKGMYQFLPSIPEKEAYEDVTEEEMKYDLNGDEQMTSSYSCIGNPYKKDEGYNYEEELAKYLYVMDLEASKVLTSEIDLEGIVIDNLAEIVKTTNTVGRKVYVKASDSTTGKTGYLGNTTKTPIESVNKDGSITTLVAIAKPETDTDFTEYITFSPPTGLTEEQYKIKTNIDNITNILLIIVPVMIIIGGISYVTVQIVRRKKFYK